MEINEIIKRKIPPHYINILLSTQRSKESVNTQSWVCVKVRFHSLCLVILQKDGSVRSASSSLRRNSILAKWTSHSLHQCEFYPENMSTHKYLCVLSVAYKPEEIANMISWIWWPLREGRKISCWLQSAK